MLYKNIILLLRNVIHRPKRWKQCLKLYVVFIFQGKNNESSILLTTEWQQLLSRLKKQIALCAVYRDVHWINSQNSVCGVLRSFTLDTCHSKKNCTVQTCFHFPILSKQHICTLSSKWESRNAERVHGVNYSLNH